MEYVPLRDEAIPIAQRVRCASLTLTGVTTVILVMSYWDCAEFFVSRESNWARFAMVRMVRFAVITSDEVHRFFLQCCDSLLLIRCSINWGIVFAARAVANAGPMFFGADKKTKIFLW